METIGRYHLQSELGRGGFGRVYKAFDPTVGRTVAVKILTAAGDSNTLARFRNEAAATGKLRHKNIVTIFDFGEHQGVPYIVMEYLEGQDLHDVTASGRRLSLLQKLTVMSQVAEGLHHAHINQVVHRDVKPANIMLLHDGAVKIMDFGIARLLNTLSPRVTQHGNLVGTVSYMAPEQFAASDITELSDIFAYGTIFYELLTGAHPFKSPDDSAPAIIYRITNVEPKPVSLLLPDCPPALEQIIHRALHKQPENRYQTLEDLQFDAAPLRLELQRQLAESLATDARQAFDSGDLDSAQRLAREALEHDANNPQARELREKIKRDSHIGAIRARSQTSILAARQHLAAGNHNRAVETLEAAYRLDPENSEVISLLNQARTALENSRRAAGLLSRARQEQTAQNLTGAYGYVIESLQCTPENQEAQALLAELQTAIEHRDRQRQLDSSLSHASLLISIDSFEEALSLLATLQHEHPNVARIRDLIDSAHAGKARLEEHQLLREASHETAQNLAAPEATPAPVDAAPPQVSPRSRIGLIAAALAVAAVTAGGVYFLQRPTPAPIPPIVKIPDPIPDPPTPQFARLQLSTNLESGTLSLDGKNLGSLRDGAFRLEEIPPGHHSLRITASNGAEAAFEFDTQPAAIPTLATSNARARQLDLLAVATFRDSHPPRTLTVTASAPAQLASLATGTREIRLSGTSYPISTGPSPTLTVYVQAKRDTGTLIVDTEQNGVSVFIDGRKYTYATDQGRITIPLAVRANGAPYGIRVEKQGFTASPANQNVQIVKSQTSRISFRMSPERGVLVISGATPGATLKLDGSNLGVLAQGSGTFPVTPGEHTVELLKARHTTRILKFTAQPGATVNLSGAQVELIADSTTSQQQQQQQQQPPVIHTPPPDTREQETLAELRRQQQLRIQQQQQTDAAAAAEAERAKAAAEAATRKNQEAQAVRNVIAQYAHAFESKKLDGVLAVWPGLPPSTQNTLKKTFKDAKSITLRLNAENVDINGNSATATCTRQLAQMLDRPLNLTDRVTIYLKRSDPRAPWIIESIQ